MSRPPRPQSASVRPGSAPAAARMLDNPFYVLGVRPDATRVEIEREGQKLLGMLELGLAQASSYVTPIGPGERTPAKGRQALAELRDPDKRVGHELWARLDPNRLGGSDDDDDPAIVADEEPDVRRPAPWTEALSALGWR